MNTKEVFKEALLWIQHRCLSNICGFQAGIWQYGSKCAVQSNVCLGHSSKTSEPDPNENIPHNSAGQSNSLTNPFETNIGPKQEDGLAPLQFNLARKQGIQKLSVDTKGTLFYKSCQTAAYTNDINIMARCFSSVKQIFINLDKIQTKFNELTKTRWKWWCKPTKWRPLDKI